MSEQEEFDDLLRSKLTGRNFPFDEHNWEKAEAILERSEKRRRYLLIMAIFMAGIGTGVGLMLPFVNRNKSAVMANEQQAIQPIAGNTINNSANLQATAQQETEQTIIPSKQNTATIHPIAHIVTTHKNNPVTIAQQTTNKRGDRHKQKHRKPAVDSVAQYSYVRPESERKKKYRHSRYNSTYAVNNYTATKPASAENGQSINSDAATKANASAATTTNTASATQKPDTSATTAVNKTDTTSKTDSSTIANAAKPNDSQQQQTTQNKNHNLLSIDAGTGYSLGWQKAGATQGNGFSPVIGISATHYLNSKISVIICLQFNSLTHVNTLYSSNDTSYSFGSTNSVNSVTLKTLYYISLPLKLQYSLNDNNSIAAGFNVMHLIETKSTVVTYNQDYFGTSGNTAATKMGYMDDINQWDMQLTLAYRRKINRFTLTAEGYFSLFDIESNSFFNNNVFERNNGIRFLVSYDIIK